MSVDAFYKVIFLIMKKKYKHSGVYDIEWTYKDKG